MPRPSLFLAAGLALVGMCALHAATHADAFNQDSLIKANVADLKDTQLVFHPDTPIPANTNLIWCGTMQLAWNEAIQLVGEKLRFVHQPPIVDLLNREDFTRHDLSPDCYVAIADFERNHVEAKIRAALDKVFHGEASPELIPPAPRNPGPDDFVAYSYLFKNLAFAHPFQDNEPITFAGKSVKNFGFFSAGNTLSDEVYGQVSIFDYQSADNFLVTLKTNSPDDTLILAKVPPGATLQATITAVLQRIAASQPVTAQGIDQLAVPKLNLDLRRDFAELEGLTLNPTPAAKIQSKLVIAKAEQLVRFQLNEKGAVLKSEGTLVMAATAMAIKPDRHEMIFDQPFLILMKQTDAKEPYFALWIGNPSLLIPAK